MSAFKFMVAKNSSGTSFSVYGKDGYLGMVFLVGSDFGASYCPPGCRNGCQSATGCKSKEQCKNKDRAFTTAPDPMGCLSWLAEKHGEKLPDDVVVAKDDFQRITITARPEQRWKSAKWDETPAPTPIRKATPRPVAQKPQQPALTLDQAMKEAIKEAGLE